MKERERFQKMRQKKSRMSLRTRLTVLVGVVVLVSIMLSLGIILLFEWVFQFSTNLPALIQINVFSLIVAVVATNFMSKAVFDPIEELREGMQKVADGDFGVRLESNSRSAEMQEVIAGFNMMAQELESTEILQTDFVSNVSHEFKTPINAIEGYTTLLQGCEALDEEQQEYVEKILFNTNRLSTLVSNILLLSKIENQSIQTHQEWYGLDEQIRESIVALERAWDEKNIEVDVELDDVEYYGNENMMYHVWINLIGNAIKFSPQGGVVKIRLRKTDDRVLFTVEDEGPGLSEEAQKHMFDKFYQEDSSHKQEGNGLGLALVKRILSVVEGSVTAENIEGGGCRFTVTLQANK